MARWRSSRFDKRGERQRRAEEARRVAGARVAATAIGAVPAITSARTPVAIVARVRHCGAEIAPHGTGRFPGVSSTTAARYTIDESPCDEGRLAKLTSAGIWTTVGLVGSAMFLLTASPHEHLAIGLAIAGVAPATFFERQLTRTRPGRDVSMRARGRR